MLLGDKPEPEQPRLGAFDFRIGYGDELILPTLGQESLGRLVEQDSVLSGLVGQVDEDGHPAIRKIGEPADANDFTVLYCRPALDPPGDWTCRQF